MLQSTCSIQVYRLLVTVPPSNKDLFLKYHDSVKEYFKIVFRTDLRSEIRTSKNDGRFFIWSL